MINLKMNLNIINKYKTAYHKIEEAHNILFVTHDRPDGDALSSVGIMIEMAEKFKKKYTAFCNSNPTDNFYFLPHIEKIISKKDFDFSQFDLIIALDCGSMQRTELPIRIKNRKKEQFVIEFDHHPKVDNYSDLEIRNPEAVATTEILYYFLKINKVKITKNIANCILTGILTDTANFLYPSTSESAVSIASEMLVYGAQFPRIVQNTWQNKSLSDMKLWGMALNNLKINKKYNFAFSVLTLEEINKEDGNEDAFDAISGFLSNLHGVKGVIFLREEKDLKTGNAQIKGSIRSSYPNIDVSKLAVALGGGGHAKASGFILEGRINKEGNKWKII